MSGITVDTPNGPFTLARHCNGCTLCCRVLEATTLDKPMGVLCRHCVVGTGCGIHETRPPECRNYHCGWLIDASLGPEWHPETAHLVITYDLDGRRLNAHADPLFPNAWRTEPYFSQLKSWAVMALPRNGQVVAYVDRHTFVILPDRAVDLGVMDDESFIYIEHVAPDAWNARRLNREEAAAVSGASTPMS